MNQTEGRRRPRRRSGVGTGTTSLLMIFTVLCFATLAMLSLSTAASNDRIQTRGRQGQQNLASAKGAAAIEVANMDENFYQIRQEMKAGQTGAPQENAGDSYYDKVLALAETRGWLVDVAANTITLHSPIDAGSSLVTELLVLEPDSPERYQIIRQVSELTNGWHPEGDGELWKPS